MLVVEDPLISKLVRAVLRKQGYAVVVAEPSEATEMLRSPETGGQILLTNSPAIFLEFATKTPLLYLSSAPNPQLEAAFRQCRVVLKPFSPNELVRAVGELAGALP